EYDPFGRRIQKKSYLSVEPPSEKLPSKFPLSLHEKTEQYLYEGEDIAVIYDESGEMQMSFVHGPGIDEPLSVTYYKKQNLNKNKIKKETHYYVADALGSIVRLIDEKGHIVESFEYDSFGNFRTPQVHMEQLYAYTGREYDTETGLYYYRARYYDPSVGRFMSKDSIGGFLDTPSTQHSYGYVGNNPQTYIDPSGKFSVPRASDSEWVQKVAFAMGQNESGEWLLDHWWAPGVAGVAILVAAPIIVKGGVVASSSIIVTKANFYVGSLIGILGVAQYKVVIIPEVSIALSNPELVKNMWELGGYISSVDYFWSPMLDFYKDKNDFLYSGSSPK
ncbi:MAG: hypothetical protein KAI70_00010, partial [Candidatus Omnitrophica bacterium]|nr:hypothetical protein [Candidatus Omnitrophota bacterium]